jgi:hypothetical protein
MTATPTQAELGAWLGITRQAIAALQRRGVLPRGGTLQAAVVAYCAHLREQAASRRGDGPLDLAQERARLAKAQTRALDRQDAVARGELVEAEEVKDFVLGICAALVFALEAAPTRIVGVLGVSGELAAVAQHAAQVKIDRIRHVLADRVADFVRERWGGEAVAPPSETA